MALERRKQRFDAVIAARIESVTLLLDELYDPHNRAAIVRSCDAFGVQELHTLQREGDFAVHNGVAKGSEHWVDVYRHRSPAAALERLRASGYELVATAPHGELEPPDLAAIPRVA